MLLAMAACGDDAVTPPPADTETSTSDVTTTGSPPAETTTSGADTTESASASATGTSTTTGETGSTTGEEALPGRTMSQLVSSGTRTSSRSYTLVHTLGQPSPLQSTHVSRGYTLQGGLTGANGSPP